MNRNLSLEAATQLWLWNDTDYSEEEPSCRGCAVVVGVSELDGLPLCATCARAARHLPWWCEACGNDVGEKHKDSCAGLGLGPVVSPANTVNSIEGTLHYFDNVGPAMQHYADRIQQALDSGDMECHLSIEITIDRWPCSITLTPATNDTTSDHTDAQSSVWPLRWTPVDGWNYTDNGEDYALPLTCSAAVVPHPVLVAEDINAALTGDLRWPPKSSPKNRRGTPKEILHLLQTQHVEKPVKTSGHRRSLPTSVEESRAVRIFAPWYTNPSTLEDAEVLLLWNQRLRVFYDHVPLPFRTHGRLAADITRRIEQSDSFQVDSHTQSELIAAQGRTICLMLSDEKATLNKVCVFLQLTATQVATVFNTWCAQENGTDGIRPSSLTEAKAAIEAGADT